MMYPSARRNRSSPSSSVPNSLKISIAAFLLPSLALAAPASSSSFQHHKRLSATQKSCGARTNSATCNDLIAGCIATGSATNPWSSQLCVVAATCASGPGALLDGFRCAGLNTARTATLPALDQSVFTAITGTCATSSTGCPITGQNYIDAIYRQIGAAGSTSWPSDPSTIQPTWWSPIATWCGFSTTQSIPYNNFNDWLHYASGYTIPVTNPNSGGAIPSLCPFTSGTQTYCKNYVTACVAVSGAASNPWSSQTCVLAAMCYGSPNLFNLFTCSGLNPKSQTDVPNLSYNVYANIVGSCAYAQGGCPLTSQNFIDAFYFGLDSIKSSTYPASGSAIVASHWQPIATWSGFPTTLSVPYTNLNDWLKYSTAVVPSQVLAGEGFVTKTATLTITPAPSTLTLSAVTVTSSVRINPSQYRVFPAVVQYFAINAEVDNQILRYIISGSSTLATQTVSNNAVRTTSTSTTTRTIGTSTVGVAVPTTISSSCPALSSDAACNAMVSWCIITGNPTDPFSSTACVAAAICVGSSVPILTQFNCLGRPSSSRNALNLGSAAYTSITGCATADLVCPLTEQNIIDLSYGTITAGGYSAYPSSPDLVKSWFLPVNRWMSTATYGSFQDWLRYYVAPDPTTPGVTSVSSTGSSSSVISTSTTVAISSSSPSSSPTTSSQAISTGSSSGPTTTTGSTASTVFSSSSMTGSVASSSLPSSRSSQIGSSVISSSNFSSVLPITSASSMTITTTTTSFATLATVTSTVTRSTSYSSLRISPTQYRVNAYAIDNLVLAGQVNQAVVQYVVGSYNTITTTVATSTLASTSTVSYATTTRTSAVATTTLTVPAPVVTSSACPALSQDPMCQTIVDWCMIIGTSTNPWNTTACIAAAFCGGTKQVLNQFACLGNPVRAQFSLPLDYNAYAGITGSCAYSSNGCGISDQNIIDLFYGVISSAGSNNFPSSPDALFKLYWNQVKTWIYGPNYGSLQYWLQVYTQKNSPAFVLPAPKVYSYPQNSTNATVSSPWRLAREHMNSTFFDAWRFWGDSDFMGSTPDPTHGSINYLSRQDSFASNLTYVNQTTGNAIIRMETTNNLNRNRNSTRIHTSDHYNTGTLMIFDVVHVPYGPASWPALWACGNGPQGWPNYGEIDIYESVNNYNVAISSLHSKNGCAMNMTDTTQFGLLKHSSNCDSIATQNQGCGILDTGSLAGAALNAVGGGVFATSWTTAGINTYFFPRNQIPSDIDSKAPNPALWGTPYASLTGSQCDIPSYFQDMDVIINIAYCGDWAAGQWFWADTAAGETRTPAEITGYNSCDEYVKAKGSDMVDQYYELKSVRIYKTN